MPNALGMGREPRATMPREPRHSTNASKPASRWVGHSNWGAAWDGLPELTRDAFRVRSHCKTQDEARNNASTLSLEGVAQNITCPLFIVNGRLDRIVPAKDAERLARGERAGRIDDDRGRQPHCDQPRLSLALAKRRLDGGAAQMIWKPRGIACSRSIPGVCDQHHLAALHAGLAIAGDDVRLNDHCLPGAERFLWHGAGRTALAAEDRRQIAATIAMQEIVDDG